MLDKIVNHKKEILYLGKTRKLLTLKKYTYLIDKNIYNFVFLNLRNSFSVLELSNNIKICLELAVY